MKQISEICEIKSGFPFESESYDDKGEYKLITIKNVQDSGINTDVDNHIKEIPNNLPDYCKLKTGNILMSLTGNVGRIGLMFADNCLLNQRVALIQPNHDDYNAFLYLFFKHPSTRITMERLSRGTSQKNLSPVETSEINTPYNQEIIVEFTKKTDVLVKKITSNLQEIQELTKLRDWLLPLLMNGQAWVE